MKYTKSAANGHAGEFFFAYKVARVLGWPCRLFDIDIGIDAQVEVLDHERASELNACRTAPPFSMVIVSIATPALPKNAALHAGQVAAVV